MAASSITRCGTKSAWPRSGGTRTRTGRKVERFREDVLLGGFRDRIALVYYEDYIALLRHTRDSDAQELAEFLEERISSEIRE